MNKIVFYIVCFTVLLTNIVAAQNVRFRKIVGEGEFANSSITAIKEDYLGRMWFGTREGLYLYDGNNLYPFLHDPNQINSISSSWIEYIEEDDKHNLWIGTTHGINKISLVDFSIQRYFYKNRSSDNPVNALLADKSIGVWLSCVDGVYRYDSQTDAFVKEDLNIDLPGNRISGVFKGKNGSILVYTDGYGIFEIRDEEDQLVRIPNNELKKYNIISIEEDQDGNYIVGTQKNGLFLLDKKLELTHLKGNISNKILSVCIDDEGMIYAGTDGDGICIINRGDGTSQCLKTEGSSGIQNNVIHRLFIDSRNNLWIGGINSGVTILDKYSAAYKHILVDKEDVGNKINVLDIIPIKGYEVLASTDGDGLFRVNIKTGKYSKLNIPDAEIIKKLYRDSRGNIWGGTYQKGLLQVNSDLELVKRYPEITNPEATVSDDNVWSIIEDDDGNMWFGTLNGGLFLFDREKQVFYSCKRDLPQFRLGESFISSIILDNEKSLWVGTKNGVYKYDRQGNRFKRFPQEFIDNAALSNNFVRDIFQDKSGRVWIGTENGLTLFENDEIKYFSQSSGLSGNRIQSVIEDYYGNIWIATTYGLNLLQENNTFRTFLESDGLSSNIFNSNSGLAFADGSLAFNTFNGLTSFLPTELYKDFTEPQIVFSDLWINGKQIKSGEGEDDRHHISVTDQLNLKYGERSFGLGFSALGYLHSEKNQYLYKLDGFDDEWILAGNERRATYTNLEQGDYIFRVKAANGDGVWNEEGISLKISVLPPWWNTMLAKFIYLVLLIGLILFFRNYVVQGERFKIEIEKKELEAKRIEELAQFKNQFFTNISHELRTPLSLIIAPVSSLLKKEKELESEQRVGYYRTIKKNSNRLLNLVNQLLDFRKLETGNWKPRISKIQLNEFLAELVDKFKNSDEAGHIQFQLNCGGEPIELFADWQMLENIFYNLVSNSIKHSRRNEIIINVGCKSVDSKLLLWVEDNGIGISAEEQEHIFDRFYQSKDHGIGSGIGLSFVKELVELHKAKIQVKSELEKGTKVELLFEKGFVHYPEEYLVEESKTEKVEELAEAVTPEPEVSGSKTLPKLLIVEDSAELSAYLKTEFVSEFRVKTAANGKEGLKIVEQFVPDIIVSDVMMPEMDGIEFCNKIKNKLTTSHIPVILLTAKSSHESQLEGYESGADAYVLKPFNISVLRKQVSGVLEIREQLKKRFAQAPMTNPKKMDISELDKRLLNKLNKYIDANLQNSELSIEGISKEIGISRSYFHKKLKALTGASASEYVRNYRLKRAAKLLEENKYSIEEVSYEVGFSSPSYFSRSFTKLYGVSPKNYLGNLK